MTITWDIVRLFLIAATVTGSAITALLLVRMSRGEKYAGAFAALSFSAWGSVIFHGWLLLELVAGSAPLWSGAQQAAYAFRALSASAFPIYMLFARARR